MTLVEVMVAMIVLGTFMLGFIDTALHSRRISESNVMQSAANTFAYGMIEQMKMLDYNTNMPTTTADPIEVGYDAFPAGKEAPYINVKLNQDQRTLLQCVNNIDSTVFLAPKETPTSITALDPTKKNTIGPLPLSTVNGTQSQALTLSVWIWVDSISDLTNDVTDAKCVTVIYAYEYNDGHGKRTVINRDVFVRTPFVPLEK